MFGFRTNVLFDTCWSKGLYRFTDRNSLKGKRCKIAFQLLKFHLPQKIDPFLYNRMIGPFIGQGQATAFIHTSGTIEIITIDHLMWGIDMHPSCTSNNGTKVKHWKDCIGPNYFSRGCKQAADLVNRRYRVGSGEDSYEISVR